ncbi:hypothetical protein ACFL43_04015 [Thermodesulfobacteriota bacterium]
MSDTITTGEFIDDYNASEGLFERDVIEYVYSTDGIYLDASIKDYGLLKLTQGAVVALTEIVHQEYDNEHKERLFLAIRPHLASLVEMLEGCAEEFDNQYEVMILHDKICLYLMEIDSVLEVRDNVAAV